MKLLQFQLHSQPGEVDQEHVLVRHGDLPMRVQHEHLKQDEHQAQTAKDS
jgi:hypothetical protein